MAVPSSPAEFMDKLARMRALLAMQGLDALLLQRFSSMAWATCGADTHINTADSQGSCALLVTPDAQFVVTNSIEAGRLENEEGLGAQGWQFEVTPWYSADDHLAELLEGKRFGHDGLYPIGQDLTEELTLLRAQLSEAEQERFRSLGRLCAVSMDEAVRAVKPGMTEFEIAALLASTTESRGAQAVVDLVGTDERIFAYRHAIPTGKKLDRYAMLVLCGRQAGLICSITRLVHFGPLPEEVERKMKAVAAVDAAMIAATRPGSTLKYVFAVGQKAYAAQGYPNEWQLHHQGGLAGYEPREITATPTTRQTITQGQAFAWNPSIKGAKSEDTILVGEHENEIITEIDGWPMLTIEAGPVVYKRPAILVRD